MDLSGLASGMYYSTQARQQQQAMQAVEQENQMRQGRIEQERQNAEREQQGRAQKTKFLEQMNNKASVQDPLAMAKTARQMSMDPEIDEKTADGFRQFAKDTERDALAEQKLASMDVELKTSRVSAGSAAYASNPNPQNWQILMKLAAENNVDISKIGTTDEEKLSFAKTMSGMSKLGMRQNELTARRDEAQKKREVRVESAKVKKTSEANREREKANLALGSAKLTAGGMEELKTAMATGSVMKLGHGGGVDYEFYNRSSAEKAKGGRGMLDVATEKSKYKAESGALAAIEKKIVGVEYSGEKIRLDIATMNSVIDKAEAIGGAKILNTPMNAVRRALSDPEYGRLELAVNQVALEYEKAMQGGQMSVAQLHASAAEEAKKLLNSDMTVAEIRAKIPLMLQEIENAKAAGKKVSGGLLERIRGAVGAEAKTASGKTASGTTVSGW